VSYYPYVLKLATVVVVAAVDILCNKSQVSVVVVRLVKLVLPHVKMVPPRPSGSMVCYVDVMV